MRREVICTDAIDYLKSVASKTQYKAIITSLPDMEEIGMSLNDWSDWIRETCELLGRVLDDNGVIFFYQTNRKYKGTLIDKNHMISNVFIENGYNKILEKICLKQKPETVNFFRPTYTNLFAFSKKIKAGKATPDVIFAGKMIYKNAMGFNAVEVCLDFIKNKVETDTIFDPFCGQGSVLKLSNDYGFNAIGIDIIPEQCEKAKNL